MKPKAALITGAICAFLVGVMLMRSPDAILQRLGLPTYGDGIILGRDVGIVVIGLAVLNWFGRNAAGNELRAILFTNLFVQMGGLAVHGAEIANHQLPGSAWPSVSIHAALSAMFGLALLFTAKEHKRRRGDNVLGATSCREAARSERDGQPR